MSADEEYGEDLQYELQRQRIQQEVKERLRFEGMEYKPLAITNQRTMPDEEEYLIEGLFPVDSNVLLTARRKTGKTTLVGNLIRSLTRREPFLGEFSIPHKLRVALFDIEMGEALLFRWLADMTIFEEERLYTEMFRGRVKQLGLLDPKRRLDVAQFLEELRIDVLIVDPLGPLLSAYGIGENDPDVRKVTSALDELVLAAGITGLVLVTHDGKDDGKNGARGHSSLEDWPDVIWRYKLQNKDDPTSPRLFSTLGRVDPLEPREITYGRDTRSLSAGDGTFGDSPNGRAVILAMAELEEAASGHVIWQRAREKGYTARENSITGDLRTLLAEGTVEYTGTEKRPKWRCKISQPEEFISS
jgi:hypothetical protein